MERQPVIDVRVPVGEGLARAVTVLEAPPPVAPTLVVVPPASPTVPTAPAAVVVWAWRVAIALAVVLTVAGMLAFASQPPT